MAPVPLKGNKPSLIFVVKLGLVFTPFSWLAYSVIPNNRTNKLRNNTLVERTGKGDRHLDQTHTGKTSLPRNTIVVAL